MRLSDQGDRARRRKLAHSLEEKGIASAEALAEAVDEIRAYEDFDEFFARFGPATAERIIRTAASGASIVRSAAILKYASERAAAVIRALKSFEEADTARADASAAASAAADVDTSLSSALELFRGKMKRGVALTLRLEARSFVPGERSSLGQVWVNLITNALQAMEYQGSLDVSSVRENGRVVVEITDSGCGIADSIKDRIFDPFFTTKAMGEGTGFGLVIAKRIVERWGGSITFESCPGRTTFRVSLPALRTAPPGSGGELQ